MNRLAVLLLSLVVTLGGCASAPRSGSAPRRSANVITSEELASPEISRLTAFAAVRQLRPNWLYGRGVTSGRNPGNQVPGLVINGAVQPIDVLQSLRAADIDVAEFLPANEATTQYGTGYANGLIRIKTAAGRD